MKTIKCLISFLLVIGLSCSGQQTDTSFQKNDPDPKVKLFDLLDETPALKSAFSNLDPQEFNRRLNNLVNSNLLFMADFQRKTADTFYGTNPVFPLAVRDMSNSFCSFHDVYMRDPGSLDDTVDVIDQILRLDSSIMCESIASLRDLLIYLRDNTVIFNEGQELEGTGVDVLIDNLDFAYNLYDGAENLDDIPTLIRKALEEVIEDNQNIEARIQDMIDFIEFTPAYQAAHPNASSIADIEKEVAQWVVQTPEFPDKEQFLTYLIEDLYPMIKDPVLDDANVPNLSTLLLPTYIVNEDDYKNFVKRGRWLLDEQAKLFSKTPHKLWELYSKDQPGESPEPVGPTANSLLTKWFLDGVYNDISWYDHIEDVPVFDFENNDLLKWIKNDLVKGLNGCLAYTGKPNGISAERLKDILWDGWTYTPTEGPTTTFKGILYVDSLNPANDGPTAKMARFKSSDNVKKPFRMQIHDILNGNNNGNYDDDSDPQNDTTFKKMNLSYDNAYDDGTPESIIESILTNLHLYLLSHYYSPTYKKWALTPDDGTLYFGDPNRNLQNLFGGIITSARNTMVLDRLGRKPGDPGFNNLSNLTESIYVLAAGYGITDPNNAPAELSVQNCLKSMGSDLWNDEYIHINTSVLGIDIVFDIRAIGNNEVFRASYFTYPNSAPCGNNPSRGNVEADSGGKYKTYATQHGMTANELLQPGTFRKRTDSSWKSPEWYGKFSSTQGDLIGISDANDKINTSNWSISEIALNCWEGYGPYTYKGRAPNGSDCKYKNDWYSDWYTMSNYYDYFQSKPRGPGLAETTNKEGRYHVYEAIYRPVYGESGFNGSDTTANDSGYTSRAGVKMPKYGYKRPNGNSYNNNDLVVINGKAIPDTYRVTLDCETREEAIRKNFKWLLNQKKYMYMIPLHVHHDLLGHFGFMMELYAYSSINCNGIAGISKAKRHGPTIDHNAIWGNGLSSNRAVPHEDEMNYVLDVETTDEPANTVRFTNVSFDDQDYCVALDYFYYFDGLSEGIAKGLVTVTNLTWDALGDGSVLPPSVGKNFDCLISMGNITYSISDVISAGYSASSEDIRKFKVFYDEYYPTSDLIAKYTSGELKAKDLPPVPKVKDVYYPTAFNIDGSVKTWSAYNGDSKGKFEDIVGILGLLAGTLHEDGIIYKNINGTQPVTNQTDIDSGNIAFYAKDGYRKHIDNLLVMLASLNETKRELGGEKTYPTYNSVALLNILVDTNADPNNDGNLSDSCIEPGSKKGVIMLKSQYANPNYIEPIKKGIEQAIQNIIRTYLNNNGNFRLSNGGLNALPEYYLKDINGDFILDANNRKIINPAVNWDIPINRLRYFTDETSLEQLERGLDLISDLSKDSRFVDFLKKTIPAVNKYFIIKYMEENNCDKATALANAFQIEATSGDIDEFVEFIEDFNYHDLIEFVKESGINDIETLYNFSFDDFDTTIDPAKMQKTLDDLNAKLIKHFSVNIKAGLLDGMYKIQSTATNIPSEFKVGETIYGTGKYIETTDVDPDGFEDNGKYYKYIDCESYISTYKNDSNELSIEYEGLRVLFDFRHENGPVASDYASNPNCEDYIDKWYKNGDEEIPNIYSLHKYDLNMSKFMNEYNDYLLNLTGNDFLVGGETFASMQETYGKNNQKVYTVPKSLINKLYGWNGSTFTGIEIENGVFNYLKDVAIDKVYDDSEIKLKDDLGDPTALAQILEMESQDTTNLRQLITQAHTLLDDKLFEYDFVIGGTTYSEVYEINETAPPVQHKHALNNMCDIISTVLNPDSADYYTERLFNSWEDFIETADISVDQLKNTKQAVGNLLYDANRIEPYDDATLIAGHADWQNNGKWDFEDSNANNNYDVGEVCESFTDLNSDGQYDDGYTKLFTKLAKHMPRLMRAYQGQYEDMLQVSLMMMAPDGIGTYLVENLKPHSRYDSWDLVEEFNYLLNVDIFREYTHTDTFWWQMGAMLEDMSIIFEDRAAKSEPTNLNFYGMFSGIFE